MDEMVMNGTANTVLDLAVKFGENSVLDSGSSEHILLDVRLNDLLDLETLDDLVTWNKAVAVVTVDGCSTSSEVLATAVVLPLDRHLRSGVFFSF